MDSFKPQSPDQATRSIDLPPNQQLAKPGHWPVVGERAPAVSSSQWTLSIHKDEIEIARYDLDQLQKMAWVTQTIAVHCVTRWSKPKMTFAGIPLSEMIPPEFICPEKLSPTQTNPLYLSFVARSERQHSTSLPLEEALALESLIAFQAEGEPLTTEHGGPIRMIVPGKYFYKSVKWLCEIRILSEDRLGYWESQAGYHNGADPWKEQRYISAAISKQEAQSLIASRDFTAKELLSLQASKLDLSELNARNALLRNADFTGSKLDKADFRGANLSNAHFHGANLKLAKFGNADLEGADFSKADIRGADFSGASLFGASFAKVSPAQPLTHQAIMDRSTVFSGESVETLTNDQREFVVANAFVRWSGKDA